MDLVTGEVGMVSTFFQNMMEQGYQCLAVWSLLPKKVLCSDNQPASEKLPGAIRVCSRL